MEENAETPIYSNWRVIMEEFKNKRIALRNEFYRLKSIIEQAETKEAVDAIFIENVFIL